MKLKTTFLSTIICLLFFSFSAKAAPACTGNGQDGDYHYQITQADGKTYMTFIPDKSGAGSATLLFYHSGNGYGANTLTPNVAYEIPGLPANGTEVSFYFTYNSPDGPGNKDNSANKHSFIVGDCSGSGPTNTPPTVAMYPISGTYTSPASITLTAQATDDDGTISKVEFYSGTTKIGETTTGSGDDYSFTWTNVQPGNYTITAKATDNQLGTTTSNTATVTVGGEFTNEWCGQSAGNAVPTTGNEFEWRAETDGNGDVLVTFHGIGGAAGLSGAGYVAVNGILMTDAGSTGNYTATIGGQTSGTSLELKFTYDRPVAGGQNNSLGNPVTYTVGTLCAMSTLPVTLTDFRSKAQTDGTIALSWATTSENNNNHFVIERSVDNKNFVALDHIASKATNSQSRLNYSFIDKNPANGNNYYRLSQVDNNGTVVVLGIVAETVSLSNLSAIYPNPLHGTTLNLSLAGQQDGQLAVDISTLAGKVVYSGTAQIVSGQGAVSLSSKPAPGLYLVKAGDKSFKLIVE